MRKKTKFFLKLSKKQPINDVEALYIKILFLNFELYPSFVHIYAYPECHFRSAPGIVSLLGEIPSDSETLYPEKDKKIPDNLRIKINYALPFIFYCPQGVVIKNRGYNVLFLEQKYNNRPMLIFPLLKLAPPLLARQLAYMQALPAAQQRLERIRE